MPGIASSVRARLGAVAETPRVRARARPSAPTMRLWLATLGLTAVYYAAAQVGHALEFAGPVASIILLHAGVGIAFLSIGRAPRLAPVVVGGPARKHDRAPPARPAPLRAPWEESPV